MSVLHSKTKLARVACAIVFLAVIVLLVRFYHPFADADYLVSLRIVSDEEQEDQLELFYLIGDESEETVEFTPEQSISIPFIGREKELCQTSIPAGTHYLRLDPGTRAIEIEVQDLSVSCGPVHIPLKAEEALGIEGISDFHAEGERIRFTATSEDPNFYLDLSSYDFSSRFAPYLQKKELQGKIPLLLVLIITGGLFLVKFEAFMRFPQMIVRNRKLVWQLAKNDFRTGFAGSYLGIIWAFVQPVVTILVYWFVFQVGLRSGSPSSVPFVLWLIAGLVPWFFFAEGLNGGTNVLIQYQYLVKKVVFQIEILPFVKLLSSLFVHLFFIAFTLVLYTVYGYRPDVYTLQIFYYSFCMFVLVLGLSYVTSSVVGFFRDLSQIIGILLQIGVWMTPIMWDFDSLNLPGVLRYIFRMNPMFYIVSGYRDALIDKVWFWERTGLSIYYWVVTILIFGFGTWLFGRLRVHFADVL